MERVQLYQEQRPLFERYGIEEELARALARRVPLKSGGHLIIEQTEAMITIDVNTGGYLGANNLEDTVFRTNLEAAQTIPRQLRLRNLGGIIVVDFIDMEEEEHRRQVMRALEKACEADPARIRLDGFSSLGLVQMSRKRTRESLAQQVCEPCSECSGLGLVKTSQTTCIEVFRAILQDARARCARWTADGEEPGEYLIRATEPVVDRLLDEDAGQLAALSREVGRAVRIQVEPSYGPGQFDVVLVQGIQRPG
jgi:ribonuclease G